MSIIEKAVVLSTMSLLVALIVPYIAYRLRLRKNASTFLSDYIGAAMVGWAVWMAGVLCFAIMLKALQ